MRDNRRLDDEQTSRRMTGCDVPPLSDLKARLEFEIAVVRLQREMESSVHRIAAATAEQCVIIYDRCRGLASLFWGGPAHFRNGLAKRVPSAFRLV